MAFIDKDDIHALYVESKDEAKIWREHYPEYERLADNDLIEDLDDNLPEVNDGSLAAALFKLPKRIVSSDLSGRAKALDADDAWITELANMQIEDEIIPNANSQAPFHRKWKDAVRKSAIYGGQPIVTLFVENGSYVGADFIIPYCQDVTLEAGKVSDYDSDIIFWDIYLSKKQLKDMIEQAKEETKNKDGYNKWNVKKLEEILKAKLQTDRDANQEAHTKQNKAVKKSGFRFYIAFQRGIDAPFYMYHCDSKEAVREWTNPDPTGDLPVHYLYCYQDMVNPYGIGIVKLAGGTQNVLDHMRRSDVLATDVGIDPPKQIQGNEEDVDEDSLVMAKGANWYVGNAKVERMELSNQVYQQLPERIAMYKTSLNQLIPVGDTSISSAAGDPNYSKTPAGVKFQAANLSIDDEDYKDNLYMTYGAVMKSLVNYQFANKQGTDLMKLNDEQRELLMKAGLEFPLDDEGQPTNELEVIWDEARATFDFEVIADQNKATADAERLEGLKAVADFIKDPALQQLIVSGQPLILGTKKIDPGELMAEIVNLATDNDKIVQDVTPEEMEMQAEDQALMEQQAAEEEAAAAEQEQMGQLQAIMEQYNVDEATAQAMIAASEAGFDEQEILEAAARNSAPQPMMEEPAYV